MARLFDDASSEYLRVESTPITGTPVTMACWFYSDTITQNQYLLSVGDKDVTSRFYGIRAGGGDAGDPVQAIRVAAEGGNTCATTTGYSANTWHHACGVYSADDAVAAFLDGGGKNTGGGTFTPAGWDSVSIATSSDSTPSFFTSGRIAEAALWNVALTDAEVAILAEGYSPLFVRPQNLMAYWPLIRDTDDDIVGGYSMTPINTPSVAAHAPMLYPTFPFAGKTTAVARIPRHPAAYSQLAIY